LFDGERKDTETGLVYLRARYMDPSIGRFTTMDKYEGSNVDPQTLHKYSFACNSPVNKSDPSGNMSIMELSTSTAVMSVLATTVLNYATSAFAMAKMGSSHFMADAYLISLRATGGTASLVGGGGIDIVIDKKGGKWIAGVGEGGLSPLTLFNNPVHKFGAALSVGLIFNMSSVHQLEGMGTAASWPLNAVSLLPTSRYSGNKAWGALTQLAKKNLAGRGWVVQFGESAGLYSPSYFSVGFRSNYFASTVTWTGRYEPLDYMKLSNSFRDVASEVTGYLGSFSMSLDDFTEAAELSLGLGG
jgi:RHS repeat-associated protein